MSSSHPQRLPGNPGGSGMSSRHTSSTSAPSGQAPSNTSPTPTGSVLHAAVPSSSPSPPPPLLRSDVGAAPAMTSSSATRHVDVSATGGVLFGHYSTAPAPQPQQHPQQQQNQLGGTHAPSGRVPPHSGQTAASSSLPPSAAQSSSAQRGRGPLAPPYVSPPSHASHSSAAVPLTNLGGAVQAGSSYASWRGNMSAGSGAGGSSTGPRSGDRHQRSESGRSGGGIRGGGGGGGSGGSSGSRHRHPQQQQQHRRTHSGAAQDAALPTASAPAGAALVAPLASDLAAESVAGLVASPSSTRAESRAEAAPSMPWPPLPPAPVSTVANAATSTSPATRSTPSTAPPQQPSHRAVPNATTIGNTTSGGGGPTRSGSGTPAHQQQQQQQRSPASATGAAVAVPADNAAAPLIVRPGGEERPTVALSQNIMSVYEAINNLFYQERQLLLAAPAKYTARKYEDPSGHYIPYPEEEIAERYVVKEVIGKGSFGTVLHCVDLKYNESVAVKVIRSGPYFEKQGWFEAQVVAHLNNDPALQNLVVQLRKVFLWKGHMVLVFEPLSFSLYRLITLTKYNGVSLDLTRKFAYQMIKVLLVLEQHDPPIIHCDLKPENVLLRDPSRSEVRVIDFGSACYQQQTEWTPPPAQVALPASSPSRSPGPPWDAVRRPVDGATTPSASASHAVSKPLLAATAAELTAGDTAGRCSSAPAPSSHASTCAPPGAQQHAAASQDASAAAGAGGDGAAGDGADVRGGGAPAAGAAAAAADAGGGGGGDIIMPKYIQSRFYRSPEVILELGYTTAIDRWSLGCFLVEMHTGVPLFPGKNEGDMMAYFTSILGPLPDYMIAASPKRQQLYHTCADGPPTQQQQQQQPAAPRRGPETGDAAVEPVTPTTAAPGHAMGSPFFLRNPRREGDGAVAAAAAAAAHPSLEEILGVRSGGPRGCRAGQPGHDEAAYTVFCDFILKLLQYDPRKRVSCQQAIQHPFLEPIRALKSRPVAPPEAAASPSSAPGASAAAPATAPTSVTGGSRDGCRA